MVIKYCGTYRDGITDAWIEVIPNLQKNKYWIVIQKGRNITNYISFSTMEEVKDFFSRYIFISKDFKLMESGKEDESTT